MVSVIVPVYNAEKFIKRCIDSILCQSYKDFELILINDGSKDNSLDIIQKYAETDQRIKVISQKNKGVAGARNSGLNAATGEYFLFVDADDWIESDAIEKLLAAADCDTDIVFCQSDNADSSKTVVREENVIYEVWDQNRQQLEFMQHKRMTGMLWNKLIKRSLAEGVSFNEKTGYGEDAEFLWQILKKSQKMVVTNEILYHHVLENTSISHLSFSDKKYSAIPMWESICIDVEHNYPQFYLLAVERLMCAAVFSMYEIKQTHYKNFEQKKHIRQIVKRHCKSFIKSNNVSVKMKLFALGIRVGLF